MKLLWSSRSPFARKVMIAAHELGFADRIEIERVVVDSVQLNREVMRFNPLGKIPTLMLDDGTALFDSRVIVEYLAAISGNETVIPVAAGRWPALRMQALGDGIMEAGIRWIDERNRPLQIRLDAQIDACRAKINAGLDALENHDGLGVAPAADIGRITVASALAHLDFRFAELGWRDHRPKLAAGFEAFRQRPSMIATAFQDQY